MERHRITPDKDYLSALADVIDPADVRWVWLTHPDRDHTGGLWHLLDAAPDARLITTVGGVGIMSCQWAVPMQRVQPLNPGETLNIGDRTLTAWRPPLFDSPVTVGLQESRGGALFASDCFGGAIPTAELASGADLRDVSQDERRAAQLRAGYLTLHRVTHGGCSALGDATDLARTIQTVTATTTTARTTPPAIPRRCSSTP